MSRKFFLFKRAFVLVPVFKQDKAGRWHGRLIHPTTNKTLALIPGSFHDLKGAKSSIEHWGDDAYTVSSPVIQSGGSWQR